MKKNIQFYKYHGAGNDFVMIDNRDMNIKLTTEQIALICHRRYGVGADGMILLLPNEKYDFQMKYYNADGNESTMCGNGGRCIVAFAKDLGLIQKKCTFEAIDGMHNAEIIENTVNLKMSDVHDIHKYENHFFINTGSPHHVEYHEDINSLDIEKLGKNIRNSKEYAPLGTNVNFVQRLEENKLFVRTFERGVEAETLACGTGATAAAISLMINFPTPKVKIKVLGGELEVKAKQKENHFVDVWLKGPAVKVFDGQIKI